MSASCGLPLFIFVSWLVLISCQPAWDRPLWPGWRPSSAPGVEVGTLSTPTMTTEVWTLETPRKEVATTVTAAECLATTSVAPVVTSSGNVGLVLGVVIGVILTLLLIVLSFVACYYYRKNFLIRINNNVQFQAGLHSIVLDDVVCDMADSELDVDEIEDIMVNINLQHLSYSGPSTYSMTCPGNACPLDKVKEM